MSKCCILLLLFSLTMNEFSGTKNPDASFQKRPQFASQDMISCGILYEQTNLSVTRSTSCALSLLSVHLQNPPCHSAGNLGPSSHACRTDEKVSKIHLGKNPVDKHEQNDSSSSQHGLSSLEAIKNGSILPSNADCADHLQVCQTSELLDAKHYVSAEDGDIVDLLQLSSHLQRVEHKRNSFLQ